MMDDAPNSAPAAQTPASPKTAQPGFAESGRLAYILAFVAFVPFFPFLNTPWGPYAATLTAYTVLVFAMAFRDAECSLKQPEVQSRLPFFLLVHLIVLAGVYWVEQQWFRLAPRMPGWLTHTGRRGSMYQWLLYLALLVVMYVHENWMRSVIRRARAAQTAR